MNLVPHPFLGLLLSGVFAVVDLIGTGLFIGVYLPVRLLFSAIFGG